jgi:hypothetical protein
MLRYLFIGAFIGEIIPLIFLSTPHLFPMAWRGDLIQMAFWPSSIFMMLLGSPDRFGEILATSIFLNMVLYAVIGLVLWFFAWGWKRWRKA